MILYHGTTLSAVKSIRKGIDVRINKDRELDFGSGFYLSDSKYALKTAKEKAKQSRDAGYDDLPVLVEIKLDIVAILIGDYKVLQLSRKNKQFLDTVFKCRYYQGKDILKADFVIAPLADGNIDSIMSFYRKKENKIRKLICFLHFLVPVFHRQYVVKSEEIVKLIKIISIKDEKGGIIDE